MNSPIRYADTQRPMASFAPYSLPDSGIPDPNAAKCAFVLQNCDRPRAEYEILECGDVLYAAQTQMKTVSFPRLYTGDIVFDEKEPNVVYDLVTDQIAELHFTLRPQESELRGILYYRDNMPCRCILELRQKKYVYSVIAQRNAQGGYEIEKVGRTVRSDKTQTPLRRIIPSVILILSIAALLASLLFAYLEGRTASMEVSGTPMTDTTAVTDSSIALLYLSDPVDPGDFCTLTVMGKPNTRYTVELLYEHSKPVAGTDPVMSDAQGCVTWKWKLPSSAQSGAYRVKVKCDTQEQIFTFHVR